MADSSFRFFSRRGDRPSSTEPLAGKSEALPLWHYLVAAILGAANTLSFAPTPHGGWLELVIFTVFFAWLTRTSGWKSAALTGWAFGLGTDRIAMLRHDIHDIRLLFENDPRFLEQFG